MLDQETAIPFHFKVCPKCHKIPKASEWILPSNETNMKVFVTVKRQGDHFIWEPIYIGTNAEPLYDERVNWEGKSDKMSQAYIMCLHDYNFNVLSNAFLVHKPGIKTLAQSDRLKEMSINKILIRDVIAPEIERFYGSRNGCEWIRFIHAKRDPYFI